VIRYIKMERRIYPRRVRDWRYTTGWDEVEGNNGVGWDIARVLFETRKNFRRTLINTKASSTGSKRYANYTEGLVPALHTKFFLSTKSNQ
jgi:hypothetical protein